MNYKTDISEIKIANVPSFARNNFAGVVNAVPHYAFYDLYRSLKWFVINFSLHFVM